MKLFLSFLAYAHGGTIHAPSDDLNKRSLSQTTYEWKIIGADIDGEVGSQLGNGVSLNADGSRVAAGAIRGGGNSIEGGEGEVKVFERDENDEWIQLGEDIAGESPGERAGQSVSLSGSGNRVAVGCPYNDEISNYRGQVRVYDYVDGSWVQYGQDLNGEGSYNDFGAKVHLSRDGMRLIVGAEGNDGINGFGSGHARVFADINGTWVQIGQDLDGEAFLDDAGSGIAISANGDRVAVGAKFNDGNGSCSGHTRVYELFDSIWMQVGQDIDGEDVYNWSGYDVDLNDDGTRIIIGEFYASTENGQFSGQARIFDEVDGAWVQVGGDIDGENYYDYFGQSVGITGDGNRVAVVSYANDDGGDGAGHVRVFDYINDDWAQIGQDLDGEQEANFISRVALSADGFTLAFGAPGNEGDGSIIGVDDDDYYDTVYDGGHVRVFELVERCTDSSLSIYSESYGSISCGIVSRFPTACTNAVAASHCPDVCSNCETYGCSNSQATFVYNGNIVNCDYLSGLTPGQITLFCSRNEVKKTCREICAFCD